MTKWLNTEQAVSYLAELGTPFSKASLQIWRTKKKGPSFVRVGPKKVFYDPAVLCRFSAGQIGFTEERSGD